jgi:large subunit ribosomal protein L32
MPVPRRRHCSSRQGKDRAHKKLHPRRSVKCSKPGCDGRHLPHRVCPVCGTYQERTYVVKVGGAGA